MKRLLPLVIMVLLIFPVKVLAGKVVFAFEVYPPYEFRENGKLVGTDVDLIREVCKHLNLEHVFKELPWERALSDVKRGKVDAIFSLVKTDDRERFLYFPSESLSHEQFIFIAKKGRDIRIKSLADLKGKRVGVCRSYNYTPEFDMAKGFEREGSLNDEEQLRKLSLARMDLAIMNKQVFLHTIKKMGMKDAFRIIDYEIKPINRMYVGFSRALGNKGDTLSKQFDLALRELKKKGITQQINERYQ